MYGTTVLCKQICERSEYICLQTKYEQLWDMNVKTSERKWAKFSHNGTNNKSRPKTRTSIKIFNHYKNIIPAWPKIDVCKIGGKILFWNGRIWNPPLPKFAVSYLYFTAVQAVPMLKGCQREMSGGQHNMMFRQFISCWRVNTLTSFVYLLFKDSLF